MIGRALRDLRRYPSAIGGLTIIGLMVAVSIYAMIAIPYNEAIRLWRGGTDVWYNTPRNATPTWTNFFRERKLPETIDLDSRQGQGETTVTDLSPDSKNIVTTYTFDYNYDAFPQDLTVFFYPTYDQKAPAVTITWITPDGRQIRAGDATATGMGSSFRFRQSSRLERLLNGMDAATGLFVNPDAAVPTLIRGTYQVQVSTVTFEPDSTIQTELVVYGQVYGLAGTDNLRRSLVIPLLWGTPVALAFGLVGALGTSLLTMIIAAAGTWFGQWVDAVIQRITEVNLILPLLPILIMIGTFYSRSLWVMLGVVIILSIFGASIKTYRAIFLQIKEAPYIEAARSYGSGNGRIIFRYMIPRIIPLLIPSLVTTVPAFVFLEASLAVLGLGDPVLPTWGKVINDANVNGALFTGYYYWVLEPAVLLMLVGLGFAMLGFSLDRVFNPRLREL